MKPFSQLFTRLSDLDDRFSFQGCLTIASMDSTATSGLSLFKDLDSSSLFKTPFIQIQRNLSGKATFTLNDGMSSSAFSGNLDKPNCFSLTYTDPSLELKEGPSLSSLSLVKQLNTSLPYPFKAGLYLQSTTDTASASFSQVSLNSLPEPTSANVSLDLPIGDVSSGMIFDASNSSGDDLTYAWDFGDGSTSTEPFVQHTYANSGKYTVSLTVKGKDGLSKTVSNDVTILPKFNETSLPDLNFHGKSTASFTFPELPTGFEYKIDLGDGSAPKTTRSFIHSFPKLGISNITIEVLDKRPMPVAPLTAADPVVYRKYTWLNHWEAKPKATMFVETTGGKDIPFGISPLAVSFDATGSTGSSLTYAWDFGDGTTGTGSKVSHTFQEGQYVVTLQVKDSFGQTDEYRAYVAARGKDSYTKSTFTYPTLMPFAPLAAETEEKSLPTTAFVGPKNVVFESQAVDTFNDYMPYVIHKSAKATQVATRWNPWSMGGSYRLSFCDSSKFFYNGFEKATVYKAVSAVDPIFCEFMRGTAADIGAIQDRADSEFFLTGSLFFQKYNFDVFSGLRVPKVMLGIVPDRVLSGEYASPYLLENTYVDPTSGKTEMMLRVLVRQSESSKRLTFKVPVYAVNDTGNWVKQANGYFKGKFSGVESDCGDCVMKEGKAYFNVTIDPELYGLTGKKIDVSRVELYADPMCKTDSSPWAKVANTSYGYLMGCTTVTTSSEVPGGALPLKPFKYPILSSSTTFFGHVVFGETAKAVEEFYEFTSEGVFEDFGEFVIDMIPIVGSGKACWEAINNYMGTVVDTAVTGLVCVVATVETVSGAKGLSKVVYKAMKGSKAMGSGALSDVTEEIAKKVRAGKKDVDTLVREIDTVINPSAKTLQKCGVSCIKPTDDLVSGLRTIKACPAPLAPLNSYSYGPVFKTQSIDFCDINKIIETVTNIGQSALLDKLNPVRIQEALVLVCCTGKTVAGETGMYIKNAEQLVERASKVTMEANLKGIISEAESAHGLRTKGSYTDMEFGETNSITLKSGKRTEPDLYATDKMGVKRIIEVKSEERLGSAQELILLEMAMITGRRPTLVANEYTRIGKKVDQRFRDKLFCKGIDLIDFAGTILNPKVIDPRGCGPYLP
ncbi:MAG: PKD domain-containing protein [Deinococcaceae bacterium]